MRGAAPRAGYFLLRGQEKVTKEKAALLHRPDGYPVLLAPGGSGRRAFPGPAAGLRASMRATLRATPPSTAMLGDTKGNVVRASVWLLQIKWKSKNEAGFLPVDAAEHWSPLKD